jgi:hypothetical protein
MQPPHSWSAAPRIDLPMFCSHMTLNRAARIHEDCIMTVFNALRDLADGLSRGLGLFLTERRNTALDVVARRDVR